MTFEEFLENTNLPNTAKFLIPTTLSDRTKRRLLKREDAEAILNSAIEEINHGSIEGLEDLVKKKINEKAGVVA